jgi:hypothetical protein
VRAPRRQARPADARPRRHPRPAAPPRPPHAHRHEGADDQRLPAIEFLDFDPTSTVDDTYAATRLMLQRGVGAIVVLGGDGTHRAVVRELVAATVRAMPLAGLVDRHQQRISRKCASPPSPGWPPPRGRRPRRCRPGAGAQQAGRGQHHQCPWPACRDIAIVDAVVTHDRTVGARALWKPQSLAAAYLAYAEPGAIGLSSIGGLLQPVGRHERGGLAVQIAHNGAPALTTLHAPIAPGLVLPVPLAGWQRMAADEPLPVLLRAGTVALDGERELAFDEGDHVTATLREHAFLTVDVARCMATAAHEGLLRAAPIP